MHRTYIEDQINILLQSTAISYEQNIAYTNAAKNGLLRTDQELANNTKALALRLTKHPTKVYNFKKLLSNINIEKNTCIYSEKQLQNLYKHRVMLGTTDEIHFTYGIPYIFGIYMTEIPSNNCLIVLNKKSIESREDFYARYMDNGMIAKFDGPLRPLIQKIYSEIHPRHILKKNLIYEQYRDVIIDCIYSKQKLKAIYMQEVKKLFACTTIEDTEINAFQAHILHLLDMHKDDPHVFVKSGLVSPEGKINAQLFLDDIHCVITYEDTLINMKQHIPKTLNSKLVATKRRNNVYPYDFDLLNCYASLICKNLNNRCNEMINRFMENITNLNPQN